MVEGLDRQGWPHKPDVGWSEYDVEVFGNRWTNLQLITVMEDYPKEAQMVRCRLRAMWSLPARAAFWLVLGLELLLCSFLAARSAWAWLLLLTLPLFAIFLHRQKRHLQSRIVVFLDETAKRWNLAKLTERG